MKPIYLDYNATTPTDPQVVEAMLPYFTEDFGNPANSLNSYGWNAANAVKKSSETMAQLIGCKPHEIIWNAGATEGNNSVIFGLIHKLRNDNNSEKIHFLTSNAEHLSVINAMLAAKKFENIEVDFIPVNEIGIIDTIQLKKYIKPYTKLVSLMWVNNEIGAINPIQQLATFCQENKIYFHTDATQAVGKIEINLATTPVHFLTFSAHKFYGPKGVGCLYIRSNLPHVEIEPYLFGGGQQNNQRSGTLNVPAIVGTAKAAELCQKNLISESERTRRLIQILFAELQKNIPSVKLNGPGLDQRSPINLNLTFPVSIDLVLPQLAKLAFSQGSACSTAGVSSSPVLKAIGLNLDQALRTMRFSVGRWTTENDISEAVKILTVAFKPN